MAFSAENKWFVQGSITSGITLDMNNTESGSIPSSIGVYDGSNYGATTYAMTGCYQCTFQTDRNYTRFACAVSCGSADIKYQFQTSSDGITYSSISAEYNLFGNASLSFKFYYVKLRLNWYSPNWSDADYVKFTDIGYFTEFKAGDVISSYEMNDNFLCVSQGDFLPRGNNTLMPTTGIYDLGSSTYRWKGIFAAGAEITGAQNYNFWNKVSSVTLSVNASNISFTGLNASIYMIMGSLILSKNSGTAYMVFNNDSGTNYGTFVMELGAAFTTTSDITATQTAIKLFGYGEQTIATSQQQAFIDAYIVCHAGSAKLITFDAASNMGMWAGAPTGTSYAYYNMWRKGSGIWNDDANTLTSIKIYTSDGNIMKGSYFELWSPLS